MTLLCNEPVDIKVACVEVWSITLTFLTRYTEQCEALYFGKLTRICCWPVTDRILQMDVREK